MAKQVITPIVMTEEYWANTQFSIARYYGVIKFNGHEYVIVNKDGKDIFECSDEAEKEGREKAIEPGEPCDLCRRDFVPIYRKLGRNAFLELLHNNPDIATVEQAKQRIKKENGIINKENGTKSN